MAFMRKELRIRNQMTELEKVNQFIDEISEELELNMELTMNLNLVVEEMVVNVISYAYPEGSDAEIELLAKSDGKELTLVLSDGYERQSCGAGSWRYGHLHCEEHYEQGDLSAFGREEPADDDKEHK